MTITRADTKIVEAEHVINREFIQQLILSLELQPPSKWRSLSRVFRDTFPGDPGLRCTEEPDWRLDDFAGKTKLMPKYITAAAMQTSANHIPRTPTCTQCTNRRTTNRRPCGRFKSCRQARGKNGLVHGGSCASCIWKYGLEVCSFTAPANETGGEDENITDAVNVNKRTSNSPDPMTDYDGGVAGKTSNARDAVDSRNLNHDMDVDMDASADPEFEYNEAGSTANANEAKHDSDRDADADPLGWDDQGRPYYKDDGSEEETRLQYRPNEMAEDESEEDAEYDEDDYYWSTEKDEGERRRAE